MTITRREGGEKQTLGTLQVLDGLCNEKFSCHTLELPDKDNQVRVSRINAGTHTVKKRYSNKFKWHFHITGVDGRSYILIHAGNFYTDILGCVLVGSGLIDINRDGLKDVTNSRNTMAELLELMPNQFNLTIE